MHGSIQQLTDVIDLGSSAGCNHVEDYNRGAEIIDRGSHSGGIDRH